ncbi:MAG: DUF6020 family protein [Lachnospiraceae bacterium]|nr:DUF6020 family protein [Lachnospiraceae bacterium]
MNRKAATVSRRYSVISIICMTACAITLYDARALFAPYLIAFLFAVWCMGQIRDIIPDKRSAKYRLVIAASAVFAIFMTLANHALWMSFDLPDELRTALFVRLLKLLVIAVIASGSYFVARSVLIYTVYDKNALTFQVPETSGRQYLFFVIPFIIIAGVYLVIYFCCYYPGLLSLDSIDQIDQLFTGVYSNHQPFYHTMLVGLFINAGLAIFNNINTAVALYMIVQVLFMAATFSFVIYNMAKLGLPKFAMITAAVWYALMPFHIMYSFTLWKDVYFGSFVTLLIVFYIRIACKIGKPLVNYIGFAVCGPVICLLRSNGMFAYVFVFLAVLLLARADRKLLVIMGITLAGCFVLKHNVLDAVGVTPPDTVESLSIPLQQVGKVIVEGGVMDSEDLALMEKIIDIDALKEEYNPDISDPVKNLIRDYGNESYLTDNMKAYVALYLRTLAHNPMKYVIAWVDSTCGYWNSGYNYWVWYWDIEDNPYGIQRFVASPFMLHVMDGYLWLYYNNRVMQVFLAVGLYVWMVLILLAKNIAAKNICAIIAIVPILAILLSLLISSPVYAEFRYMYALFCSLPVLIAVTCTGRRSGPDR